MNKTIRLLVFLFSIFICGHASANANKKAQAYYFAAEEAYNNKQYEFALDGLEKAETLLDNSNALLEGLKVKIYYEKE